MNDKEKHKQADQRKRDGETHLNKLGLSLNSELLSIGIILENLSKSSINENLLNGVNYIFNNFVGIDLNIFAHTLGECFVFLLAPILDLRFVSSWTEPLIVVNKATLETALTSKSKIIFCCSYNGSGEMHDPRVKFFDKPDLVEIIKEIVKNEKK